MLSVKEAETLIFNAVRPLDDTETVDLANAGDRVLAANITSDLDFPHWDNSAMDGYAVRFEDVKTASETHPITLRVTAEIPAGTAPKTAIAPGEAARIFTGSMLPEGTDTIVMQENTKKEGDRVSILIPPPQAGAFVRRRGDYYQAGNLLLEKGTKLGSAEVAVLAAARVTKVPVFRKPRVAILSTGSELVTPDRPLEPGQIVDSNQYALATFVKKIGCEPVPLGIVSDTPEALKAAIENAIASADVVLSSGGVSVGDYDWVDRILAELGGNILVRSVAMKPGKPLTIATFSSPQTLYFGLPGNPVSALATCWRFVRSSLLKLSGVASGWQPVFVTAKTRSPLKSNGKRETYFWGQLYLVDGSYEFDLARGDRSSGNLINLAGTNGLAVLPVGETAIAAGETVSVLPMS